MGLSGPAAAPPPQDSPSEVGRGPGGAPRAAKFGGSAGGGKPAPESTGQGPGFGGLGDSEDDAPCPTRAQACTGGGRWSARGAPSTREELPGPETPDWRPSSHLLFLSFGPALLATSWPGFWFCSISVLICHSPSGPGWAHTPSHFLLFLVGQNRLPSQGCVEMAVGGSSGPWCPVALSSSALIWLLNWSRVGRGALATHFSLALVPAWSGEGGARLLTPLSQARHLETCGTQCPTWSKHRGEWSSRDAPRVSCIPSSQNVGSWSPPSPG